MSSLHVDRLSIRVPGADRELGRALARQVAERLAPSLALAPGEASFDRLQIEIAAQPGESPEALAARIAAQLGFALGAAGTLEAGR
jgi:hypothetical protein